MLKFDFLEKALHHILFLLYSINQEFIQVILMSCRRRKKIESSNWVFKPTLHKILF